MKYDLQVPWLQVATSSISSSIQHVEPVQTLQSKVAGNSAKLLMHSSCRYNSSKVLVSGNHASIIVADKGLA